MASRPAVTFATLREKIRSYLMAAVGPINNVEITYAKLVADRWNVNVEYSKAGSTAPGMPIVASLSIDGKTGHVIEFERGRPWKT